MPKGILVLRLLHGWLWLGQVDVLCPSAKTWSCEDTDSSPLLSHACCKNHRRRWLKKCCFFFNSKIKMGTPSSILYYTSMVKKWLLSLQYGLFSSQRQAEGYCMWGQGVLLSWHEDNFCPCRGPGLGVSTQGRQIIHARGVSWVLWWVVWPLWKRSLFSDIRCKRWQNCTQRPVRCGGKRPGPGMKSIWHPILGFTPY